MLSLNYFQDFFTDELNFSYFHHCLGKLRWKLTHIQSTSSHFNLHPLHPLPQPPPLHDSIIELPHRSWKLEIEVDTLLDNRTVSEISRPVGPSATIAFNNTHYLIRISWWTNSHIYSQYKNTMWFFCSTDSSNSFSVFWRISISNRHVGSTVTDKSRVIHQKNAKFCPSA